MSATHEAERAGFDLTLVEANLSCSPEQRALNHQQALVLVLELERAGRIMDERAEPQRRHLGREKDVLAAKELRAILERRR